MKYNDDILKMPIQAKSINRSQRILKNPIDMICHQQISSPAMDDVGPTSVVNNILALQNFILHPKTFKNHVLCSQVFVSRLSRCSLDFDQEWFSKLDFSSSNWPSSCGVHII